MLFEAPCLCFKKQKTIKLRIWARSRGDWNLGATFESNRLELSYSLCIRQKIATQCALEPPKGGKS